MCMASLVSLPEMGREKLSTLKDLYQYIIYYSPSFPGCSFPSFRLFKFEMEEKSRSCSLWDTWFSSCGHFERVAVTVGVGTDDFTDKTYGGKRTSWCSSRDSILFSPSLSTTCDFRQHASSEERNASSSHDLFSEKAENQATFRENLPSAQANKGSHH